MYAAWYVGETENFKTRLVPSHEKWPCALEHGVIHVHALVADNEDTRLAIERDLIAALRPECNDQLKGGLLDLPPVKH